MMNDYQKRMSSTGLSSYAQSSILLYNEISDYFTDEEEYDVSIYGSSLPGFMSFQRSVDRYLIQKRRNKTLTAYEVRDQVINSFSVESEVGVPVLHHAVLYADEELVVYAFR